MKYKNLTEHKNKKNHELHSMIAKTRQKRVYQTHVCHKHKNMPLNSVFFRNMIFVFLCIQNMCGKQNNTYIFNSIYMY